MNFEFKRLSIPDVVLIKIKMFKDNRGIFSELFKYSELSKIGIKFKVVQINHAFSKNGVLRGLHFQNKPKEQAKIVFCLKGRIFDVAVDIRKHSIYFGKHVSFELSENDGHAIYIPRGFAHGYLSLSNETHVIYLTDEVYSPQHEAGIKWCDPTLSIKWPKKNIIISKKDRMLPYLSSIQI